VKQLQATRYMRVPFFVTGHRVTEENMEAVARWCEGSIIETGNRRFIRVPIANVRNVKQTEAHIGDHVLKSDFSGRFVFKVEKDEWIGQRFIQIGELNKWIAEHFMSIGDFNPDGPTDDLEIDGEDDVMDNVRSLPVQKSGPRPVPQPGPRNARTH
jgi:hypothetical protein